MTTSARAAADWNQYWLTARDGAYTNEERPHPVLTGFLTEALTRVQSRHAKPRVLDVASGSGAVVERIVATFSATAIPPVTCVDLSQTAVERLRSRFGARVEATVADANALPFPAQRFDAVTSLFGVEYAGEGAIAEAGRVVAPEGFLILVLHHRNGAIHAQCAANADALERMQRAEFLPRAERLFATGFAAVGGADRAPYDAAARALAPAIAAVDAVFADHGPGVAGGALARLYRDIERLHRGLPHQTPRDVLRWLHAMRIELDAYAGRMRAMCAAALDETAFARVRASLTEREFAHERADALYEPGADKPLAWGLIAKKKGRPAAAP